MVRTQRGRPSSPEEVELHSTAVLQKTLMEPCLPLAARQAGCQEFLDPGLDKDQAQGEADADDQDITDWNKATQSGAMQEPPQGLLKQMRAFAQELEAWLDSTLLWVQGVPEPFGMSTVGSSQAQVVSVVWTEAQQLETQQSTQCNTQ